MQFPISSPSTFVDQSTLMEQEKISSLCLHFPHPLVHYSPSLSPGETQPHIFHDNNVKLDIYVSVIILDISRSVACSSRTTVTGPWRENPLQLACNGGSISNGTVPLVNYRTWQWIDYTIAIALPRIVRQAGFLRRIFRTRGRWCTGASFVFPHLGSTISMGDVRWNIHDSRIVSKRVLNRTLAKLFVRAFFRAGGIGCFQFRDLLRILKGVV